MYPSCCAAAMPVPPAIGPDDRAGLVFIYPQLACTYTLGPPSSVSSSTDGDTQTRQRRDVAADLCVDRGAGCAVDDLTSGESGTGNGAVTFIVGPNVANPAERSTTIAIGGALATVTQSGDVDSNGDGLCDTWVNFLGCPSSRRVRPARPTIPMVTGFPISPSRPPGRTHAGCSAATWRRASATPSSIPSWRCSASATTSRASCFGSSRRAVANACGPSRWECAATGP